MPATILKQGSGKELRRLFAQLSSSISETLGSLVGRELVVRPGNVHVQSPEDLVGGLPRSCAVARGALDKAYAGKTLCCLFEAPDAVAMAGLLMMTPDEIVAERRAKGTVEGDDAEAFGELGNVLFSGFSNVLREAVGNIDVRLQDHGVVKPGFDKDELLGSEELVDFTFHMKVGEFPESVGHLVVDRASAELWNKGPLELVAEGAEVVAAPVPAKPAAPSAPRVDEEGLDSIPAAPIRGALAAFVMQPEVLQLLRYSCRRVGLELKRHGRGEIPNPAAHKNGIVLMDVPLGEERRFDWCKRIKDFAPSTKVLLLLHHPSRQRVMQAIHARADAILGFPCEEPQLSQKLEPLAPPVPSEPPLP